MGGCAAPDLKQTRPDPAQGLPDSAMNLALGQGAKCSGRGVFRSDGAMKLFTGWIMSAGLVLTATAANAQVLAPYGIGRSPYAMVSDVEGRYAAMPPDVPAPRYGPTLLPPL